MSTPIDHRRVACEFVIAAAVCGSAYYFLPAATRAKIDSVRQEIAQAQARNADRAGLDALTDTQVAEIKRLTVQRAAEIRARSAPAADEATMFSRVSEIASACSVRLEQLNPVALQAATSAPAGTPAAATPGAPGGPPAPEGPPPPKDKRIGYNLAVSGSYAGIVRFIGAVNRDLGYSTIRAVRLSQPDLHKPDELRATIDTEHLAVDLSAIKVGPAPAAAPGAATPAPHATAQAGHE